MVYVFCTLGSFPFDIELNEDILRFGVLVIGPHNLIWMVKHIYGDILEVKSSVKGFHNFE